MISKTPVFIAISLLLFHATLTVRDASGSSSSICQERISHSRPPAHCRARSGSNPLSFSSEWHP
eukprot:8096708-Pyramimonas_sp.AAC.1